MQPSDIRNVQQSFEAVLPISQTAGEFFYADLFATAPEVKPYFRDANIEEQGRKLMTMLATVVRGLDTLDRILPVAQGLAIRHVDYGVKAEDYDKVGASLLRTLEQGLGEAFTPDIRASWVAAYGALSGVMIAAAYPSEETAQ